MLIKLFHTADLHLGMQFITRGYSKDLQDELRKERFDCLERMIETANTEKCDLFVIAGDMFQSLKLSAKDIKESAKMLNSFEGTAVIILPGNHDYYNQDSKDFWKSLTDKTKDNLLIFLDKQEKFSLSVGDTKIRLYPGPCFSWHSKESMIEWIKNENIENDYLNIGISHGSVEGFSPDMDSQYFPKTIREIQESNLDLWLLGHTHSRYPVEDEVNHGGYFIPATPAPDGFDCFHKGSAWLIEIKEDKTVSAKSVTTGKYYFRTIRKTINSITDTEELLNVIKNESKDYCMMKLILDGSLDEDDLNKIPEIGTEIKKYVRYLEFSYDEIRLKITKEFINNNFTENSFPHIILNKLIDSENRYAPQLAYDLLKEVNK